MNVDYFKKCVEGAGVEKISVQLFKDFQEKCYKRMQIWVHHDLCPA